MLLHRPCLGEVRIENETVQSQEFNRSSARACVQGAMSMLELMPDNPTAREAFQLLPWWALLHFLAQATAILLLELALEAQHFVDESNQIVESVRKAMNYLHCMTAQSLSAYRAWRVFRITAEVSAVYDTLDLVDVPEVAPQPPAWSGRMEDELTHAFSA